jgi:hypothetical protein
MASARTDSHPGAADRANALRPAGVRMLERIVLGALTMVLSVNVWTGLPLLAQWIGSRFAFGNKLSMGGIVITLVSLGALMYVCLRVLAWLSARYDRETGRRPLPRHPRRGGGLHPL